jgi:hypothetical protein
MRDVWIIAGVFNDACAREVAAALKLRERESDPLSRRQDDFYWIRRCGASCQRLKGRTRRSRSAGPCGPPAAQRRMLRGF